MLFQVTEDELDEIDDAIIFAISEGYGNVPLLEKIHLKVVDYKLLSMGI